MKLRTTAEQRAHYRRVAEENRLAADLAADVDDLLAALISEKRAHAATMDDLLAALIAEKRAYYARRWMTSWRNCDDA
jgi:hypothetical protein